MLTFNNFIENQSVKSKFEEIATLIAENQVDPNVLIKAWFDENEPEMSVYLTEAGFWDGIKQAGSAAWQGMKQGVQNFNRAYSGPESYYNSAVDSLQKLSNYVHNDPLLQYIPEVPPYNISTKYNHRALSFNIGINYLFNLDI